MIIAAETNFVLELAFRQSEARDCERLIELAASGNIELVMPMCSLFEPYETLIRRNKARAGLLGSLRREVSELARSEFYLDLAEKSQIIAKPLIESGGLYEESLRCAIASILRVATLIPLSASIMDCAVALRKACGISPQDAFVAASVDFFMREKGEGLKFFANKNWKDFMDANVQALFQQCDCRVLRSFTAARYVTEVALQS